MNQFDRRFTWSASFWSASIAPLARHARIGSIHVELLSNHNTSCGSMLLSIKVSHWMFLGFLSSDELVNLDNGSAYRFSDRGICVMTKCFNSLVASRTRRTYVGMVSSLTSYVPLNWLTTSWESENAQTESAPSV